MPGRSRQWRGWRLWRWVPSCLPRRVRPGLVRVVGPGAAGEARAGRDGAEVVGARAVEAVEGVAVVAVGAVVPAASCAAWADAGVAVPAENRPLWTSHHTTRPRSTRPSRPLGGPLSSGVRVPIVTTTVKMNRVIAAPSPARSARSSATDPSAPGSSSQHSRYTVMPMPPKIVNRMNPTRINTGSTFQRWARPMHTPATQRRSCARRTPVSRQRSTSRSSGPLLFITTPARRGVSFCLPSWVVGGPMDMRGDPEQPLTPSGIPLEPCAGA